MKTDNFIHTLLLLSLATVFSGVAWPQANINESLESAFVYVDGIAGSDLNPGTQAKPFKTIGKAARVAAWNNQHSTGTRVTINPGLYREAISLNRGSGTTSLPVTFEAAKNGTVTILGSDIWTGWQPYSGNSKIYTHAWPYTWGLCPRSSVGPREQDINLRREMFFVNGTMLTQVLTLSQLGIGTFFVDETHATAYIFPAPNTDIRTATIEVATRDILFSSYNMSNIVLRGLSFEHGNSCRANDAVRFFGSTTSNNEILIDNDSFNWNNAGGLGFSLTRFFTVQNSLANHNGQRGFNSFETKDSSWASNEADYNNWRGAQGGIYGWGGGGFHFFAQHDSTISGAKMFFNMTHGTHWDTDDANITADSLIVAYNLRDGLIVEASEGPTTISNSHVCYNAPLSLYYDGGMGLRASTYVSLRNNFFVDNTTSEIPIIGIQGGVPISVTNYETGQQYNLLTTNLTLNSNTVVGGSNEQLVLDFDQAGTAWSDFQTTLASDYNTWWNGSLAQPFTVPVPAYFTTLNWAGWRSDTGQEGHSVFAQPSTDPTGPCNVTADAPDFWFVDHDTGSLTVTAGSQAVYTLMLIPIGGFKGTAKFASYGVALIPGATKSWSQSSLTGSGTVTFTVNTSGATPPGMYPLTFSAHSGSLARTVTVFLVVQ
jgi:hypothetical protein